jgi:nucleoside-diphosphate-sugar epimerase
VIVVSGATGFIGSHLVARLLRNGHDVVGVSRYDLREESRFLLQDVGGQHFLRTDHTDDRYLDTVIQDYRPSAIIHLDANVNPPGLQRKPLRAVEENFLTTVRWLEASVRHTVPRVIVASSVGVLPSVQYEPIDESHPLVLSNEGPGSGFYGASKGACELFVLSYRTAYGLEFSAVRCSAVFGFGMQWPIGIKPVIDALARDQPLSLPGGGPPRDYTPVDYIAEIFEAAALVPEPPPGILYGATGRAPVTVTQLNEIITSSFPASDITITDENTDPDGVESLYRGTIDMGSTRTALGISQEPPSLATSLVEAVSSHRDFLTWRACSDHG